MQKRGEKHSNYWVVRANRLAFSRKGEDDTPHNFSMLTERTGGMALPTSANQMSNLARDYNVGIVVSCIEDENCPPPDLFIDSQIQHLSIDWKDRSVIDPKLLIELIAKVERLMNETGKNAIFHCFAGKGRTGTSLAVFEVYTKRMKPNAAIEFVRHHRPHSIETEFQEKIIFDCYNHLYRDDFQEFTASTENFSSLHNRLRSIARQRNLHPDDGDEQLTQL